jgi:tetratricopeptide (TPR) repeat protein
LDALLAHSKGDMVGEYRAYTRVVAMTPGSEWKYKLAGAALHFNRPQEAVDLLTEVDPEQGWLARYEPYWQVLARARHLLGDYELELQDIRRGRRQLPESIFLRFLEFGPLAAMGQVELPASNYVDEWGTHVLVLDELFTHGHEKLAQRLIADHLTRYDPTRDSSSVSEPAYWLARAGRLEEAAALLERAIEDGGDQVWLWGRFGVLAAKLGQREEAARASERLVGERWQRATTFRVGIAAYLGDNEGAMQILRQAHDVNPYELHFSRFIPESLRDYPPFQELVRPKG